MSNLSRQFEGKRQALEDIQRRRYARKHESGFTGSGFWYWNYPNMVGSLTAGTLLQSQSGEDKKDLSQNIGVGAEGLDGMPGDSTGMGQGGTATSLGGMM